ncbi:hypothetical protein [Actinocatenispora thailandica]|uniref:hypothetical protein n=1 Tax=Actinocatenispora thailandica TaxID=227318 RepID=UPI001951A419|nr:hypothetical protein [Actinocatenispora thailandica]
MPSASALPGGPETPAGMPVPGATEPPPGIMIGLPGDPQTATLPPGYLPVPPAPRRRRRWPWVAGAVALLLVLGAVGVPLYQRLTRATPTEQVQAALLALRHAPAIRLTGESITPEGATQRLALSLDGKRAYGKAQDAAGSADVLVQHGITYLRGDRSWWRTVDSTTALYLADHWSTQTSGLSVDPTKLTPAALAKYLGKGLRAIADPETHAVPAGARYPQTLGGTAVSPYRLPNGSVVFVTADTPYRLVGIDRGPGMVDGGYLDLTVATLTKGAFGKAANKYAGGLGDADPKEPAHYDASYHNDKVGECDPYSCTLSALVTADSGSTGKTGHAIGVFTSDENGKHIIGTCVAKLPSIKPGHSGRTSCTTTSSAWTRWVMGAHNGSHYWFWLVVFDPGLAGDHPTQAVTLLTSGISVENMYSDGSPLTQSEDLLGMADHLIAVGGWKGSAAVSAAMSISDAGALGVLQPLVMADRVALDPDTFPDWFGTAQLPAAIAAKERAAAGSRKLALGSWTDPDGTIVKADLIDVSAKATVTTGQVATTSRTRTDIEHAADRARKGAVPDGFGRQLRITASPRSALYWSSAKDVAAGLRAAGLTPAMLHGIRRIRVVTGFGTATLTPNQLHK